MARRLVVEILGDASSLERAYKKAGAATEGFGGAVGKAGKAAGIASLAIGGGLAFALKKSLDSANLHAVALAQTQAAVKSTGKAAGVTAKQITSFSDALEKQTGIDDLAIQKGQNLLLTFTKIRNEVGKGNNIFTQATKVITDMSVALGEDTKTAAIQVGKALNDPVKGISALARVGVTFSSTQKDLIKDLVLGRKAADNIAMTYTGNLSTAQLEQIKKMSKLDLGWKQIADTVKLKFTPAQKKSLDYFEQGGHQMRAQKIILKELNKEFGGSAKAFGKTLPGQIQILKARLDDVAQRIGEKLAPAILQIIGLVDRNWPKISKTIDESFQAIDHAWERVLRPTFEALTRAARVTVEFMQQHWPEISKTFRDVAGIVTTVFNAVWPTTSRVVKIAVKAILPEIKALAKVISGMVEVVSGLLHGDWSKAWDGAKKVVSGVFSGLKTLLKTEAKIMGTLAVSLGKAIGNGILDGLKTIGQGILKLVVLPINAIIRLINKLPFVNIPEIPLPKTKFTPPRPKAAEIGPHSTPNPNRQVPGIAGPIGGRTSAAIPVHLTGFGGIVINGGLNLHGVQDVQALKVELQKEARRSSSSRAGRFAGHNLGLA